jgi:hypothetical protein
MIGLQRPSVLGLGLCGSVEALLGGTKGVRTRTGTSLGPSMTRSDHRWITEKLGLGLNEAKTRVCDAERESFDFLGYTFGPMVFRRTGKTYVGATPSKKRVRWWNGIRRTTPLCFDNGLTSVYSGTSRGNRHSTVCPSTKNRIKRSAGPE